MLHEMKVLFLSDREKYVTALRDALHGSLEKLLGSGALFRSVHTLKSISLMLGYEHLGKQLDLLERSISDKNISAIKARLRDFLDAFDREALSIQSLRCDTGVVGNAGSSLEVCQNGSWRGLSMDSVVEVLFKPSFLSGFHHSKNRRYVYYRRSLIPIMDMRQEPWVVIVEGSAGFEAFSCDDVRIVQNHEVQRKAA